MKKILFLVPYVFDKAPSQRLKFEQYFAIIKRNGYEIEFKAFIDDAFWKIVHKRGYYFWKIFYTIAAYIRFYLILFKLKQYDVVYTHLWGTPLGFPIFEKLVRKFSRKLIYDIDDLVYLKQNNRDYSLINLVKGHQKPLVLMKAADHVITCTPYLDDFVQQYNSNTTDISSTVDTENRYMPKNSYTNDKPIVIGWSGSHTTIQHFLTIKNVLKMLHQKYNNIKFKLMGGKNVFIEGVTIECVEWSEAVEISTLQDFDIGLYPLPNEQWVYGKSGLKAIQYMALGIPTVATAIGTNFRVIEDNVSGFLVNSEKEWVERLSELIENPDLRKRIGQAGRAKVEKEFSIKANASKYLSIFEQLTTDKNA